MIVVKYILKSLMAIFGALPLWLHRFNAGILAFLVGDVFQYRRSTVVDNLTHAFPEKSEKEIRKITRQFYLHFADVVTEAFWFGGCHRSRRLARARLAEVVNPEEFLELDAGSPSMMMFCSHAGNWEIIGGLAADNSFSKKCPLPIDEKNLSVSFRAQSSRMVDEILRDNRLAPLHDPKNVPGYMESGKIIRYILENRDKHFYYSMITDQRPYISGSDSIEVTFMGRRTRTMSAAASLARKGKMSVCYLKMTKKSRGHYLIEFVPICKDASTMSVQEIMDRYYALMDEQLREQPFNYLWTHRRWASIS